MNDNRIHSLLVVPLLLFDASRLTSAEHNPEDAVPDAENTPSARALICATCGAVVTSSAERTFRDDSFEHVFTNPGGFVYRIGCFRKAPGCLERGEPTDFFTWFRGYAWSFAVCRSCVAHLGWHYTGREDEFFGLILNHLKAA